MIIEILTLFPEIFSSPLQHSILGKALQKGLLNVNVRNIRDYAFDKHRQVDDRPFGGGSGMLMKPEPLAAAIEAVRKERPGIKVILLTPQGKLFNQEMAKELTTLESIALICGRYEGIDERIREHWIDDEISIGDYVLSGGEFAALVVVDVIARLVPGVLGDEESCIEESFSDGLLEYPQYTRPRDFKGYRVPEVLLSGNHEAIKEWRRRESLRRTFERRPDLLKHASLGDEDKRFIEELKQSKEETD
ncbi:MAG TPA: tRNA (guanosine(37)-N1)-methyltransferase TrmD [Deltaproteobacteria bacterium]|nr:tRNA (guanosine(37)-N1)-methyltransferase TrmD [Deltaproteobacteria bacterium]